MDMLKKKSNTSANKTPAESTTGPITAQKPPPAPVEEKKVEEKKVIPPVEAKPPIQ